MSKTVWTPEEALKLILDAKEGSNFLDVVFEVAMFSGPKTYTGKGGPWTLHSVRSNYAQTKVIREYRSEVGVNELTDWSDDWTTRLQKSIEFMHNLGLKLRAGIFTVAPYNKGVAVAKRGKCSAVLMQGNEPVLADCDAKTEALAMCAAMLSARIAGRI